MPNYRIIKPEPGEQRIADLTAEVGCLELNIELPVIKFVEETHGVGNFTKNGCRIDGLTWPRGLLVYIRCNLEPKRLVETCAHELRHCQQFQQNRQTFDVEIDERDARIFAMQFCIITLGDPSAEHILEHLSRARRKQIEMNSTVKSLAWASQKHLT